MLRRLLEDTSNWERLQRAKQMGFDTSVIAYHGSPDARHIRQGFSAKENFITDTGDPETVDKLRTEMANERSLNGTSGEYFRILDLLGELRKYKKVFRGIYFTVSRQVANTYADDHRASDYQNSEPDILKCYLRMDNTLSFNALGKRFAALEIHVIEQGIEDKSKFHELCHRFNDPALQVKGRIRTQDLEGISQMMGYDSFDIRNVVDDYNGKMKPTRVLCVFDPSRIRSVDAEFDPSKISSTDLFA